VVAGSIPVALAYRKPYGIRGCVDGNPFSFS
jgi:hypothetical protein